MQLPLNYYSFSLLLGSISSIFSAALIIWYGKRRLHLVWFLLNISMVMWAIGLLLEINTDNTKLAYVYNIILHLGGILLAIMFFWFSTYVTNTVYRYRYILAIGSLSALVLLTLLPTRYFVSGVQSINVFKNMPIGGQFYIYYTIYFFVLTILGEYVLIKNSLYSLNTSDRLRYKYIAAASIIGYIGGAPTFFVGNSINIPPFLVILIPIYPIIISYAIIKHNLFEIRVISSELLLGIVWIVMILKIVFSNNNWDLITSILILFITITISIFSIRKTKREIAQREKIESLARELENINSKLRDLDELKSEFISLATHHISSPLTAIKGYVSLLKESRDIAEYNRNIENLHTIDRLTNNTVNLIKDFLEVHKIDDKKVRFEPVNFYIKDLIDQIYIEYEPILKRKNIEYVYTNEISKRVIITADKDKLTRAISNILENSVKYSENGFIKILAQQQNEKVTITIEDNGVRNLPTVSPRLLRKLTQSGNLGEANIIGNGIGIYAAKLLIEGNSGRIWIESDNNSTKFNIELSIVE